jgi:hypothetical protein
MTHLMIVEILTKFQFFYLKIWKNKMKTFLKFCLENSIQSLIHSFIIIIIKKKVFLFLFFIILLGFKLMNLLLD